MGDHPSYLGEFGLQAILDLVDAFVHIVNFCLAIEPAMIVHEDALVSAADASVMQIAQLRLLSRKLVE
jgi:hypothetical protein